MSVNKHFRLTKSNSNSVFTNLLRSDETKQVQYYLYFNINIIFN